MISRRLIAVTPVLLVCGIVAQVILLALAIVLYIPLLVWPGILNKPYQWITRGMAKIMVKTISSRRREEVTAKLSFRDLKRPDTPGKVPPPRRVLLLPWS